MGENTSGHYTRASESRHRGPLPVANFGHLPQLLRIPLRPVRLRLAVVPLCLGLPELQPQALRLQRALRRWLGWHGLELALQLRDLFLQGAAVVFTSGFERGELFLFPVGASHRLLQILFQLLVGLRDGGDLLLRRGRGGELGPGLGQGDLQLPEGGGAGDGLLGGLLELLLQPLLRVLDRGGLLLGLAQVGLRVALACG
mmetsp:Transcript_120414/g.275836  ORF Transcript_120414/g.275836 Transcript_120414/m.275836 type:complete len:200 (-) Transcript_120414:1012-1611(-)